MVVIVIAVLNIGVVTDNNSNKNNKEYFLLLKHCSTNDRDFVFLITEFSGGKNRNTDFFCS